MGYSLEDLKIGLVLAGGGAKGAYEAGVFKTLWELELIDNINVISGTSIGAVNALLFGMDDRAVIRNSWSSLSYSRFINAEEKSRSIKVPELIEKIKHINIQNSIIEQIRNSDIGLLSQSGIKNFIEEYVDVKYIKESPRDIYACAYNIDKGRAEYFRVNDYDEKEILDIVLASCAIPFIFSPINIEDNRYADGGIVSPEYTNSNIDNVPIAPLKQYDCDLIIVVHLSYKHAIDRSKFEGKNIIEIYPSTPLELINGAGSLMLKQSTLRENIELGYRDSMIQLAPIIIKIIKGESFDDLIQRNIESNKKYLR